MQLRILLNKWPYGEVVPSLRGHSTEGPADSLILKQHVQDTFQPEESGTGLPWPNINHAAKGQFNSLSPVRPPSLIHPLPLPPPLPKENRALSQKAPGPATLAPASPVCADGGLLGNSQLLVLWYCCIYFAAICFWSSVKSLQCCDPLESLYFDLNTINTRGNRKKNR